MLWQPLWQEKRCCGIRIPEALAAQHHASWEHHLWDAINKAKVTFTYFLNRSHIECIMIISMVLQYQILGSNRWHTICHLGPSIRAVGTHYLLFSTLLPWWCRQVKCLLYFLSLWYTTSPLVNTKTPSLSIWRIQSFSGH